MKKETITGYDINGCKVIRTLEKGESLCADRCPICNSLMVENYDDAPYRGVRCAVCGNTVWSYNFNQKMGIKKTITELQEAKAKVIYLSQVLDTLTEKNKVREFNGKMKLKEQTK